MVCEIDQSGKVEDTRKLTVVCFANGKKSKAHQEAIATFQGKRKPDVVVKADDVFSIFFK